MPLSLSRMPFKNMKAHPVRSLVLLFLAAAQAACVFGGAALSDGARESLSLAEERLGADVLVYPYEASARMNMDEVVMQGTPVSVHSPRSELSSMADCEGIRAVSHQLYLAGPEGGPAWIVGFEPETDFALAPWVDEGRSFALPAGSVLVGSDLELVDGCIDLYGRSWPVGAHLQRTGSVLDRSVFLAMDDFGSMLDDAVAAGAEGAADIDPERDYSVALVRVVDKADVGSVANWLKVYLRKTQTVQSEEALTATAAGIGWQSMAVGAMAVIAWAVLLAALAVAQTMSMRERRAELFVWRASGASKRVVASVLRREAVMLHLAGALVGVAVAVLVSVLLPQGHVPAAPFTIAAAVAAVALSALVGWVSASIVGARTMNALKGQMLVAA